MYRLLTPLTSRRLLSTLSSTCTNCARPLPTPLPACTSCGTISPVPDSVPFHDLFALPARPNPFVIDPVLLKRRFREAQAVCHPDTWTSRGPHKQDIAQALSSRLNEAYNALVDPVRRAEYILEQNGVPTLDGDRLYDMDFIDETMQTRESIDETEDVEELASIIYDNAAKMEAVVRDLEQAVGEKDWKGVKEAAVRLKYLDGIGTAGKQKRDEILLEHVD